MSRIPGAVMDARPGLRAEEREVIGGYVDRTAPRPLDLHTAEPGQEAPQSGFRASSGRRIGAEAAVHPAGEADRPRPAPHQHAPVLGRPEVVKEHPAVDDRLASRPADPG